MLGKRVRMAAAAFGATALVAAACSSGGDMSGPGMSGRVTLQSVSPGSGGTGVSITMPMVMRFSGPVANGMEKYLAIHEGSVSGSVVGGRWSWSDDRWTLTFTPDAPLKSRTTYVIHMGGGMQGQNGMPLDYGSCAGLGGQSVSAGMMGSAGSGMMGQGWQGADGSYGMIFLFTTA